MAFLQLKDPFELFLKGMEFIRGYRFLSRRDIA